MTRKNGLPRRVYVKHGAYYFVTPANKWLRLSAEKQGLAAMFRALAKLTEQEAASDLMPAVIGRWLDAKKAEGKWASSTEKTQEAYAKTLGDAFQEFRPDQVTTPVCAKYLSGFVRLPRTHNAHRTLLRQVLAFAAMEGLREGFNPVDNIKPKAMEPRKRFVSDAEIAAIKAAALQASRNGEALVRMIDLALITGQRIGDLLKLRWQDVTDEGVFVQQDKTSERLLIQWSPDLRAAIEACVSGDKIGHVLRTQTGHGYRYWGIRSAWVRACERAQIEDLHIHDLRGRAGMDQRDAAGLESARDLLGHKSIKMTEHYVDGKAPRRVTPAR